MGLWNDGSIFDTKNFKMIELFIETLQGTAFELRVSPLDTVADVKARICKLEGIPMSQQHLLFNSVELDDDYSLQDYGIQDGNTLKLVPMMRVGPINTRRIHIEEPSLRDYADYFTDANREELYDKISSSARPLTVIVYQNGDQINLYRIVDRDSASPLSESLSNTSMYGGVGEEEEEDPETTKEKLQEDDKMREKIKQLKLNMDKLNLEKKPKVKKQVPRPPLSGRTSSKSKLRRVPSSAGRRFFNKNVCLPPVGSASSTRATVTSSGKSQREEKFEDLADLALSSHDNTERHEEENDTVAPLASLLSGTANKVSEDAILSPEQSRSLPGSASSSSRKKQQLEQDSSAKLFRLSSVKEDEPIHDTSETLAAKLQQGAQSTAHHHSSTSNPTNLPAATATTQAQPSSQEALKAILEKAEATAQLKKSPYKWEISQEVLLKDAPKPHPPTSPKKEMSSSSLATAGGSTSASYAYKDSAPGPRKSRSRASIERLLSETGEMLGTSPMTTTAAAATTNKSGTSRPTTSSTTLEALKESLGRPATSSKRVGAGGGAKGGVILESLNPSEVRAVSGALSNFVRTSSRASRNGFIKDGRIPTPESRLVSARFRMSASRDGHITPHRLPPVKHKKKATKRCALCNKKTGLATSYLCRCDLNFCATHRYAESHGCTFDYKTEGRKLLEQSNPVVTAPKLPKI